MRRRWILVAAVLVCGGVAAQTGVAFASSGTGTLSASSCSKELKKFQTVNDDIGGDNFSRIDNVELTLHKAAKEFHNLASSGPHQLRSAFGGLARLYKELATIDFSNTANFAQLSQMTRPYASDLTTVARYFARQCNVTIPTT